MVMVTLIGKKLAKVGNEIVYVGITTKCKNCKLKTVCSNLQEGRTYKIVKVREKFHECSLHEGGVVAVEVEKQPAEVNIRREEAEGTAVNFHPIKCEYVACEEYEACNPLIKEKEYKIVKILGDVKCKKGLQIKKALIDDIK